MAVTAGDVNGDGKADLVAANSDGVAVLLGNGLGSLRAAQIYAVGSQPAPWRWPTSTATASSTSSRPTTVPEASACCSAPAPAPSGRP